MGQLANPALPWFIWNMAVKMVYVCLEVLVLWCRFMFGLAAVPAVIQFIGFLFMPDTPRWLIAKGRYDKARSVLHRIHGTSVDVEQEVTDIINSVQQSAENRKSYVCINS